MEVVDNREHILGQIQRSADERIKELEKAHKERLKEIRDEHKARLKESLAEIEEQHKKDLSRLEKQKRSNFDLFRTQRLLEKQSEIYCKVLEKVLATNDPAVYEKMIKRLGKGKIHVPEWVSVAGTESTLSEPKVVAVLSDNNEKELLLQDLVKEHHGIVHEFIKEL